MGPYLLSPLSGKFAKLENKCTSSFSSRGLACTVNPCVVRVFLLTLAWRTPLKLFFFFQRNHAKMLLIASFAFVVMLGGGVGVAIGAHFLSEVLGMTVPPEVISRASHMAFLSVLGKIQNQNL